MQLEKLLIVSAFLLFLTFTHLAFGQNLGGEGTEQKLNLDVYLYETGKALVTGYVEEPISLAFLRPPRYTTEYAPLYPSSYKYENDTRQLYAWTDSLTMKNGETWKLFFSSRGFYSEYHVVFHLPGDLMLGRINSSEGLNYLVSASNDSLTVNAHGYKVRDPAISVEYQQPMVAEDNNDSNNGNASNYTSLIPVYILLTLAFAAVGWLAVLMARRKGTSLISGPSAPEAVKLDEVSSLGRVEVPETMENAAPCEDQTPEASALEADLSEDSREDMAGFNEMPLNGSQFESPKKEIAVSSEMKAVMDALTHRERSIIEALIKHGGRTTQAEIRYETGLPRSSLTMVLVSLERRNLITKKEWGRTNVIELSESFFSKKEQS